MKQTNFIKLLRRIKFGDIVFLTENSPDGYGTHGVNSYRAYVVATDVPRMALWVLPVSRYDDLAKHSHAQHAALGFLSQKRFNESADVFAQAFGLLNKDKQNVNNLTILLTFSWVDDISVEKNPATEEIKKMLQLLYSQ